MQSGVTKASDTVGALYRSARDHSESKWISNKFLIALIVAFGLLLFVSSLLVSSVVDQHFVVNPDASYTPDQVTKHENEFKGMKVFAISTGSLMIFFAAWFALRLGYMGLVNGTTVAIVRPGDGLRVHALPSTSAHSSAAPTLGGSGE